MVKHDLNDEITSFCMHIMVKEERESFTVSASSFSVCTAQHQHRAVGKCKTSTADVYNLTLPYFKKGKYYLIS